MAFVKKPWFFFEERIFSHRVKQSILCNEHKTPPIKKTQKEKFIQAGRQALRNTHIEAEWPVRPIVVPKEWPYQRHEKT